MILRYPFIAIEFSIDAKLVFIDSYNYWHYLLLTPTFLDYSDTSCNLKGIVIPVFASNASNAFLILDHDGNHKFWIRRSQPKGLRSVPRDAARAARLASLRQARVRRRNGDLEEPKSARRRVDAPPHDCARERKSHLE